MHLKSIALKGFKSFPDRTKLEFAPGVSVIVGPNGSGKSNVTDAVLWALGEQSPLAVRGQTMQDVIFAGGHGIASRSAAEVEIVIDNANGALAGDFSELSIVRRLERSGEGEYRLNGARCRLVDVIDALSDTGLGKEMHSVVSQGRVEAIIHSKPRDRRLLIEEAAGLGKHRKRRRRAQLKLERTEANLSRALDVEREARSRLRPLKRQAEAAELHERVERQMLEAKLELARDALAATSAELAEREAEAVAARAERDESERLLAAVAERREQADRAFREQSRRREARSAAHHSARSAGERISMRLERARDIARLSIEGAARRRVELEALEQSEREASDDGAERERISELEAELEQLHAERERRLAAEVEELERSLAAARERTAALDAELNAENERLEQADRAAEESRLARRDAEAALERARRHAAEVGSELASANHFLSTAFAAGASALGEDIAVEPGYELPVAAVLGRLLRASVVDDVAAGERLLDSTSDGATAIVAGRDPAAGAPAADHSPPAPGAEPLRRFVRPGPAVAALCDRLLRDAWVVESLEQLPAEFRGIAATTSGRVLFAGTGELRQVARRGEQELLEQRNRRDELIAASEQAASREAGARAAVDRAHESIGEANAARESAETAVRTARRARDEAEEDVRRAAWLVERRRSTPDEGPSAVREAELRAELRAERRLAEQAAREREERRRRIDWLRARLARDGEVAAMAERAASALEEAAAAVAGRIEELATALAAEDAAGEQTAQELQACAREEAEIQRRLHAAGEAVTQAEVRAQRLRDATDEARAELTRIAERLGLEDAESLGLEDGESLPAAPAAPAGVEEGAAAAVDAVAGDADAEPSAGAPPAPAVRLTDERRAELTARLERLERRRESIGPVNPLARHEYEEAVAHVEELESQRSDLETALAELEELIRDTDRQIRRAFEETFEAAARNFEETVAHLFPGGRGRLRLVKPDGPRPVLGGGEQQEEAAAAEESAPEAEAPLEDEPGVEIEVTPAGKATKRLSLMSGGEKSLVALAFLFAVFLARPCPFYILDEVEAALDDANIDRFLQLVRQFSDRAQFIIVTHQKRTMDAADCLYGVSMGGNGVSKVVSRRLPEGSGIDSLGDRAAA